MAFTHANEFQTIGEQLDIITTRQRQSQPKKEVAKPTFNCEILGTGCPWIPGTAFERPSQVKEDILRHWKPFRCELCGARFGKPNGLTRHRLKTQKGHISESFSTAQKVSEKRLLRVEKLQKAKGIQEIRKAMEGWRDDTRSEDADTSTESIFQERPLPEPTPPSPPPTPMEHYQLGQATHPTDLDLTQFQNFGNHTPDFDESEPPYHWNELFQDPLQPLTDFDESLIYPGFYSRL